MFTEVGRELPSPCYKSVALATAWSSDWHPEALPIPQDSAVASTRLPSDFLMMPESLLNGQVYRTGSWKKGTKEYMSDKLAYMTPDLTAALLYSDADVQPTFACIMQLTMPAAKLAMPILNVGRRNVVKDALVWCTQQRSAAEETEIRDAFFVAYGVQVDKNNDLIAYEYELHKKALLAGKHVAPKDLPSDPAPFEAAASDGECVRVSVDWVDAIVHKHLLNWAQAAYGPGTMIGSGRLLAPVEQDDYYQHSEIVAPPKQGIIPYKAISVSELLSAHSAEFLERITRPDTRALLESAQSIAPTRLFSGGGMAAKASFSHAIL